MPKPHTIVGKLYNRHFRLAASSVRKAFFQQLILGVSLFLFWGLFCFLHTIPQNILPSPIDVITHLILNIKHYSSDVFHTLLSTGLGLFAATFVALVSALFGTRFRFVLRAMSAFGVLSQTTPVIAIAPVLIYVFNFSLKTQAVIAFLISFFPLSAACVKAISFCPRKYQNLADALQLRLFDKIRYIDGPRIIEAIITNLPLSAVLALIGSIVYEFVSPDKGIGKLIVISQRTFEETAMFSAVMLAILSGFGIFAVFELLSVGYRVLRRDLTDISTTNKQ